MLASPADKVDSIQKRDPTMRPDKLDTLALQRLYQWQRTAPDRIALTQPMGGGVVRDYTWAEVTDQVRRMAAHLRAPPRPPPCGDRPPEGEEKHLGRPGVGFSIAQGWSPGSRVAILSKNCA